MQDPSRIQQVVVTGNDLSLAEVVAVARLGVPVSLAAESKTRIDRCRAVVEILVEEKIVAYGINTGFGALRNYVIPEDNIIELQRNLIRSHSCGVGIPFPSEVVKAAMLLRANALAKGNSGVRVAVVEALLAMLNLGICPVVPCQGSVGASGDLTPLSHIALVLMGDAGGLFYVGRPGQPAAGDVAPRPSLPEELSRFGFTPVALSYKEGLALNNGTQMMTAIACLVLYDAYVLMHSAEMAAALSLEAEQGVATAFDARIHEVRPLAHQQEVAARLRQYVDKSAILTSMLNSSVVRQAEEMLEEFWHKERQKTRRKAIKKADGQPSRDWRDEIHALHDKISRLVSDEQTWVEQHVEAHPWQISHDTAGLSRVQQQVQAVQTDIYQIVEYHSELPPEARYLLQNLAVLLHSAVVSMCPIQDDYSFRCHPQVIASAWRAWQHACEVASTEINSATDNPLIFPPEMPEQQKNKTSYREWLEQNIALCRNAVCSGGNFHGEPVGMVMDYLKIALAAVGNISERRVATLVDAHRSQGLPPFLTPDPGLNSGFMIPQYTAAALVSENKVLSHPATVDSIPTSANAEDHVSMGTIAARHCAEVLRNVGYIVAIELMTAHQALSFRRLKGGKLAQRLDKIFTELVVHSPQGDEQGIPFYRQDRVWTPVIETLACAVRQGKFAAIKEEICG
jgi:histidine ammonia-lyase